jgi:hypothetical protein
MELRCARCGAAARAGARFCVACGQALPSVSPPPGEAASTPSLPAPQPLALTAAAEAFQPPAHLADKIRAHHSRLRANAGR